MSLGTGSPAASRNVGARSLRLTSLSRSVRAACQSLRASRIRACENSAWASAGLPRKASCVFAAHVSASVSSPASRRTSTAAPLLVHNAGKQWELDRTILLDLDTLPQAGKPFGVNQAALDTALANIASEHNQEAVASQLVRTSMPCMTRNTCSLATRRLDSFGITPDTSFFFSSGASQEAMNTLLVAARMGEGFIGQCARDMKRLLVSDVPEDTVPVGSVFFQALPLVMDGAAERGLRVPESAAHAVEPGADAAEVVDISGRFLAPGFIDLHVHTESAMLTPGGYAEAVGPRGTPPPPHHHPAPVDLSAPHWVDQMELHLVLHLPDPSLLLSAP